MKVERLIEIIDADFFTGVPDSQLKALCDYLMYIYGIDSKHHIIAANEGNCTAIAAGYHLATGKVPVVYMQNSGEGNVINPVASLLNEKVYGIPALFIIGWRGEPGIHDEPQHIYQGAVTIKLLADMNIASFIIGPDTTDDEVRKAMDHFRDVMSKGGNAAFVIRKGALTDSPAVSYRNKYKKAREAVIDHILNVSEQDPIVCTTGKASRELFELRNARKQSHQYDFLTVGSMGHSSSIALGIALNKPNVKIWCIDGDGAALMHMGAMAVIGANNPSNLVHIILNNGAHETVGGMPTVATQVDFAALAKACGYPSTVRVESFDELDQVLLEAKTRHELSLIEIAVSLGSRKDLGRPTTTANENKQNFMRYLETL